MRRLVKGEFLLPPLMSPHLHVQVGNGDREGETLLVEQEDVVILLDSSLASGARLPGTPAPVPRQK